MDQGGLAENETEKAWISSNKKKKRKMEEKLVPF